MQSITELNTNHKRVLIRADFNVPIKDGRVTNDKRIRAALPTIKHVLQQGAKVILCSHLGRPQEGSWEQQFSLEPIAQHLSQLIGKSVRLVKDWQSGLQQNTEELILLENVRFNSGEKSNSVQLAKAYAGLCDIFVMDAFGTAHRAHASTHGVAQFADIACAGLLLQAEINGLQKALTNPTPPILAIVGGSKVSTKLTILESLIPKVQTLIVGGGIANTFLAAEGHNVGQSLYEPELVQTAKALLRQAHEHNTSIPLPADVVVGNQLTETAEARTLEINQINETDAIFDIGPNTTKLFCEQILQANIVIWNGPVGAFEFKQFSHGTKQIANAIANSKAFSIAGGGDTIAAIADAGVESEISLISTGGGAFLEFLEGKSLPAIEILNQRA